MCLIEVLRSEWTLLVPLSIIILYFYSTKKFDYFEKNGLKALKPVPFMGNFHKILFQRESYLQLSSRVYKSFPNEQLVGFYEFQSPVIMIRDPEIIKRVTIKDFDHFMDHRGTFDENVEPLFGRNLFQMRGQKWKDMRSTLSPAFTGSKIKNMFGLVNVCAKEFIDEILDEGAGKPIELEMKDLFTRFATDVIGTCAFGVKVNSWKDKNNDFFEMGKTVTNFEGLQGFKFIGFTNAPKLMKFFKISLFDEKTVNFFRDLVHGTIKYREANHVFRPDMINLLMQARKMIKSDENEPVWEDDDLTAQSLIFFLAGFDPSSTLMTYMSHELAFNPDVQKRLVDEIDEVRRELNGSPVTHEVIQKMKYFEMIISETLRKWPPIGLMDRYCTKDYLLEDEKGNKVNMKIGDGILIPTFEIQNDPKYFANPEKFNPERFSEEHKDKIEPFTYLPFGDGPRNCIGSRFALLECKIVFFYILSSYRIEVGPKTESVIKMKKTSFNMTTENGFWFKLMPRRKQ